MWWWPGRMHIYIYIYISVTAFLISVHRLEIIYKSSTVSFIIYVDFASTWSLQYAYFTSSQSCSLRQFIADNLRQIFCEACTSHFSNQVPTSFMPRNCMVWRLLLLMARCNMECWISIWIGIDSVVFVKSRTCLEVSFGAFAPETNWENLKETVRKHPLNQQCHIISHRSTRIVRGCTPLMSAVVARLVWSWRFFPLARMGRQAKHGKVQKTQAGAPDTSHKPTAKHTKTGQAVTFLGKTVFCWRLGSNFFLTLHISFQGGRFLWRFGYFERFVLSRIVVLKLHTVDGRNPTPPEM